jgi:hypothetical protein
LEDIKRTHTERHLEEGGDADPIANRDDLGRDRHDDSGIDLDGGAGAFDQLDRDGEILSSDVEMEDVMEELAKSMEKSMTLHANADDPCGEGGTDEDTTPLTVDKQYLNKLHGQIEGLARTVIRRNQEIKDLQAAIAERDGRLASQDEELGQAADELISLKLETKHHIDDKQLEDSWNQLHYQIKGLVSDRFGKSRLEGITGPKPCPGRLFDSLTANVNSYWKDADHKKLVIQAYIWGQLVHHVFGHRGQMWAGGAHDFVGMLRYTLTREFTSVSSTFTPMK